MDYKNAGVDIEAGYKSVELMKEHIKKTMREEVLTNIGGFSGAFSLDKFKNILFLINTSSNLQKKIYKQLSIKIILFQCFQQQDYFQHPSQTLAFSQVPPKN